MVCQSVRLLGYLKKKGKLDGIGCDVFVICVISGIDGGVGGREFCEDCVVGVDAVLDSVSMSAVSKVFD